MPTSRVRLRDMDHLCQQFVMSFANPASKTFKRTLFEQKMPFTAFAVADLQKEYERLKNLGVVFLREPTQEYGQIVAVFDDTCGNFIQMYQEQK